MAAIFENADGRAGVTCAHAQRTRSEPKGYYSRLFQKPVAPIEKSQEPGLIELGQAMRYGKEREGTLTPRVGFTYFGQFLGHDLTHDVTPLEGPYPDPEHTPNYRTPSFDLDHVYGGGPDKSPYLYEGEPGAETFRIGATTPTGYPRDLPVKHGTVLIGDQQDRRNLDNLILRQLHVVFLKFHNEAIRQISSEPALAESGRVGIGNIVRTGPATRALALPVDYPARFFAAHSAYGRLEPPGAKEAQTSRAREELPGSDRIFAGCVPVRTQHGAQRLPPELPAKACRYWRTNGAGATVRRRFLTII